MIILASLCLLGALVPCALFLRNLSLYRTPAEPPAEKKLPRVSVLIPARNEETNITAALGSVLANRGMEFEVVVLDDHSMDRTAELVREIAAQD